MFTPMVNPNSRLALSWARERKLQKEASTARILKHAHVEVRRARPSVLALFGTLLSRRF